MERLDTWAESGAGAEGGKRRLQRFWTRLRCGWLLGHMPKSPGLHSHIKGFTIQPGSSADRTISIILSIFIVLTEILTVYRKTRNHFINTRCIDLVIIQAVGADTGGMADTCILLTIILNVCAHILLTSIKIDIVNIMNRVRSAIETERNTEL